MRFAAYPGVGLRITLSLIKDRGFEVVGPSESRKRYLGEMDQESKMDQRTSNAQYVYKSTRR
jgi:hypothetical protein